MEVRLHAITNAFSVNQIRWENREESPGRIHFNNPRNIVEFLPIRAFIALSTFTRGIKGFARSLCSSFLLSLSLSPFSFNFSTISLFVQHIRFFSPKGRTFLHDFQSRKRLEFSFFFLKNIAFSSVEAFLIFLLFFSEKYYFAECRDFNNSFSFFFSEKYHFLECLEVFLILFLFFF